MALAAPVEVGTMFSAAAAQVLVRRVLQVLVLRVGVDGGHQATLDGERVVQHLGQRGQAVGGAGGVRDHGLRAVVLVVVGAQHHGQVLALGRGGDDDLLGAALVHVLAGGRGVGEE